MPPLDRKKTDAQALSGLLSARPLKRLIRAAKQQQVLEQLLIEVIPENVMKGVSSWQIEERIMLLKASSASWATRLRAYQNDLLFAAERHPTLGKLYGVKISIQNRSQHKRSHSGKQHAPAQKPSQQAVNMVKTAADGCEHEELRVALDSLIQKMQTYRQE